jgi:nanoRNase/pAp phosphatase (c-di-AMP/oligoRNAs hydrolase)
VSRIASELGGGGHTNAAGCYIKGDYAALKSQLLSLARRLMEGK